MEKIALLAERRPLKVAQRARIGFSGSTSEHGPGGHSPSESEIAITFPTILSLHSQNHIKYM